MTSITNDSVKYQKEIKRRLTSDYEEGWASVWTYCEMTQMLVHGYSLTFLLKGSFNNRKLLYRSWQQVQYLEATPGIYNLDHIHLHEEEIAVSLTDLFFIQEWAKKDIRTLDRKGIVLDGYHKEFTDHKTGKTLTWNLDDEMNAPLSELVYKIKSLTNKDL